MPISRLTVAAALASMLLAAGSLQAQVASSAKPQPPASTQVARSNHAPAQAHTTAKSHAVANTHGTSKTLRTIAKSHHTKTHTKTHAHVVRKSHRKPVAKIASATTLPSVDSAAMVADKPATLPAPQIAELTFNVGPLALPATSADAAKTTDQVADGTADAVSANAGKVTDLRKALIGLAMNLRDTRYVRGGSDPATGFDCSGFVRYVFAHAVGMKLPTNSASQFLAGLKVDRADMKPGDLVFFRTGSKHQVSHVGIYLSNGRFIHSPATGKTVQVSSLRESYWARHFAGAKRPSGIVAAADNG